MFELDLMAKVFTNPALRAAAGRISRLPENRLRLLWQVYRSLPQGGSSRGLAAGILRNVQDNPTALEWLLRIVERLDDQPLRSFINNLLVGQMVAGQRVRREFLAREGFESPVTIVINPTMVCNLNCNGCYSGRMPRKQMEHELLRKVLLECRQMGTRFITVSGGEPFVYKRLFELLDEFSDLMFMSFTNGTLIDEDMADRLAAAGNLMPAFSVEGFGDETDSRRGTGVHDKVLRGMRLLRERGVAFGFSATATRQTSDVIATDEFIDYYLDKGCLFGWLFQYLPLGKDADLSLMPTPEQRDRVRAVTKHWQATRPAFVGDFWNDGACVGACLSANRYCYVTAEGKVQPCTFVHYYTHDLNECSLLDVFRSPFFRAIRGQQPYSKNLLLPCKIIDRPDVLREVVQEHGAMPSYPGADNITTDAGVRAFLDSYAERWEKIAEEVWEGPDYNGGRDVLVPFLGRINVHKHFYQLRTRKDVRQRAEARGPGGAEGGAPRDHVEATRDATTAISSD